MRRLLRWLSSVLVIAMLPLAPHAQTGPAVRVLEVDDGVYIFQYGGYQSMFAVAAEGVVVTDPINARAANAYVDEIRKITSAPIRYVVYSHHHFDHIEGGAVFKDAGAIFVAHQNAAIQLERLNNPAVVLPEQLVDEQTSLVVGDTQIDLHYFGRNHSDNSLVISVPDKKVIYAADWLPVRELIWRSIFDSYIDEWFEGIDRVLELDWEKLIVSHVRAHNLKGWGDKDDIRLFRQYFSDLKEAVRVAHMEGRCPDRAVQEVRLPQYESWFNYESTLPLNVDRMCLYWRNGWQ